jgi:hypothetical protein
MIIFAILVITGLSVQRANIDRLQNIRNTNNFLAAKNLSKSVIGRLQQIMDEKGPGYNFKAHCEFSEGGLSKTTPVEDRSFCEDNFLKTVNPCTMDSYIDSPICKTGFYEKNEIVIDAEIKGRNETPVTSCTYMPGGNCYTVPTQGEGSAGDRELMPVKNALNRDCDLYKPTGTASDLDHECNWNRLSFGSTATDRVVIPLYYTDDEGNAVEFHKDPSIQAHFVLRVRIPCKEWKSDGTCNSRYTLDTGTNNSENDIVLQWQITGECDEDGKTIECGMIPWVSFKSDNTLDFLSSGISEDRINLPTLGPFVVLRSSSSNPKLRAIDTLTYLNTGTILNQLPLITNPSLVLFLSKPLIEDYPKNGIPYLEYQLLSYGKISNPSAEIEAKAKVNGNNFESKIQKSVSGALIDFAIQN